MSEKSSVSSKAEQLLLFLVAIWRPPPSHPNTKSSWVEWLYAICWVTSISLVNGQTSARFLFCLIPDEMFWRLYWRHRPSVACPETSSDAFQLKVYWLLGVSEWTVAQALCLICGIGTNRVLFSWWNRSIPALLNDPLQYLFPVLEVSDPLIHVDECVCIAAHRSYQTSLFAFDQNDELFIQLFAYACRFVHSKCCQHGNYRDPV